MNLSQKKKLPTSEEAQDTHRNQVRSAYAQVAQADDAGTSTGVEASCCGVSEDEGINTLISTRLGYSQKDLDSVPSGFELRAPLRHTSVFAVDVTRCPRCGGRLRLVAVAERSGLDRPLFDRGWFSGRSPGDGSGC